MSSTASVPATRAPTRHERPFRVLHFTDSLEPSGLGQHIRLLAQEFRRRGYQQTLVCPDVATARWLIECCAGLGLEVHALCVRDASDVEDYRRLVVLLRRGAYDLVHNHIGIAWEGCWGTLAAAEAGVPVVCTEHLPFLITNPNQRELKLHVSRLVTRTIAVSQGVARSFVEHGVLPPQDITVVRNGIDPAAFSPAHCPELRTSLLGITADRPLVVCIGRMTPQKGHALLLEAVAQLHRNRSAARRPLLALAGDGPLRPQLEQLAHRLGITSQVCFLGRYARVPDLLRCADVLVQPSEFEGLPLTVLEGMASALPVIVTDVVGNNEAVVAGEDGLVVPPGNVSALAEALEQVLDDPVLAARLGARARSRVEREFTAARMAQQTAHVYQAVLRLARAVT
jgi:glycosyltransferase involved in cell wall biosynthesis